MEHTLFYSRPVRIELNKDAFITNINKISKFISSLKTYQHKTICAILKSNAYGHSLAYLCSLVSKLKSVKYIGVTAIEEGILLREKKVTTPVLLFGSIFPFKNIEEIIHYNITPTVASIDVLKELDKYGRKFNKRLKFHLEIDTGMGRTGILPHGVERFISLYHEYKNVYCEGIYTHFSSAKEDKEYTLEQLRLFNICRDKFLSSGIKPEFIHTANSAAILLYKETHFNMVRPGLLIYGLLPFPETKEYIDIEPVLSLKSKIVFLKTLPKGKYVSYGKTYRTKRATRIATIPCGYADGLIRKLSNRGKVIIKGEYCDIIGRVTMDMLMVDVTNLNNVCVGDEVVFIGKQGNKIITTETVAEWCETINYEVVTLLSPRIPRVVI